MLTNLLIKQYRKYQCDFCEEKITTLKDDGVDAKRTILLDHMNNHLRSPIIKPELEGLTDDEKLDHFTGELVYVDGKIEESPMID